MRFFGYKISHIFRKKYDFKNIDKVRLKEAFTVEGIKYYEPSDINMFPWGRALAATYMFNKLNLGVYPQDLEKYFELVDRLLTGEKFNVTNLIQWKKMNDILRVRMSSPFRPEEAMYELASVFFLDDSESPYHYDSVYAQKKISFWKKHKPVNDFFLQAPLQRLIPFLPITDQNSNIFTETVKELAKAEENISNKTQTNLYEQQLKNLKNSQSKRSAKGMSPN